VCDLNLDKRLFHTDLQMDKILAIQTRYGQRVKLETFTEEHLFTIESRDPGLSVEEIAAEFGLIDYQDYIDRCTLVQAQTRAPSSIK
jgi:hypothetical protein